MSVIFRSRKCLTQLLRLFLDPVCESFYYATVLSFGEAHCWCLPLSFFLRVPLRLQTKVKGEEVFHFLSSWFCGCIPPTTSCNFSARQGKEEMATPQPRLEARCSRKWRWVFRMICGRKHCAEESLHEICQHLSCCFSFIFLLEKCPLIFLLYI